MPPQGEKREKMAMLRGYVTGWKEDESQDKSQQPRKVDIGFDSHRERAASWETREQAESDAAIFEHWHIAIPSADGGQHVCRGFHVEERAPGESVVFCEAPFILKSA